MQPSERITLLREIGTELSRLSKVDIGLTLRQFGVETGVQFPLEENYEYIIRLLECADDLILIELQAHVFPNGANRYTTPQSEHSEVREQPSLFKLFVSHITTDQQFVVSLKAALQPLGIEGFVAHADIEPTAEWQSAIMKELRTCDALAAVLSPGFSASAWTDQEIGFCLARGILIIPVCAGLDPYGFFARFQGMQGSGKTPEQVARSIFDVLVRHEKTALRMTEALVALTYYSRSYEEARRNVGLLKNATVWSEHLLQVLLQAPSANRQISAAWGVSSDIQSLVDGKKNSSQIV